MPDEYVARDGELQLILYSPEEGFILEVTKVLFIIFLLETFMILQQYLLNLFNQIQLWQVSYMWHLSNLKIICEWVKSVSKLLHNEEN